MIDGDGKLTITGEGAATADDAEIIVYYSGKCSADTAQAIVNTKSSDSHVYLGLTNLKPSISLSSTSSGIKITVDDVSCADGFRIYKKESDGTYTKVKTLKGHDTLTYTDKDVKNGSKYSYKVRCYVKHNDGKNYYSKYSAVKSNYYLSQPTISKLTSTKTKTLTPTWKKNSKVSGYQIQVATNSGFTNNKKTVTAAKSKISATVSGLKSGKTYYVRIRGYKTVDETKYYSAWSSVKKIKTQ